MDREKKVDDSWKEEAAKEKEHLKDQGIPEAPQSEQTSDEPQPREVEINFINYVTSLGFQALIFMGEIPNPITNQMEKNLIQSKFIIDTLIMLKDKTKGNLNDQEKKFLESSVYDLQMKYVEVLKKEESHPQQKQSEGKSA